MAGEKAKGARRMSHSNPVAIMVVRHRVVIINCCGRGARGCCNARPQSAVAGRGLYRLQQAGIDVSHGL